MEKKDREQGRTHLDPLEQATEALPKLRRRPTEEPEDPNRLDHKEGIQDPNRLSYSEQLKRL